MNDVESNELFGDIIIPPHIMRTVIDKTISFIVEHGLDYIDKMIELDVQNSKFPFLRQDHPYNEYFKKKLELVTKNITADVVLPIPPVIKELRDLQNSKSQMITVSTNTWYKQLDYETLDLQNCSSLEIKPFHAHSQLLIPHDILATIHITAKYAAIFGIQFLKCIATSERHNEEFQFLQPSNAYNAFFTSAIKVYRSYILPDSELLEILSSLRSTITLRSLASRLKSTQLQIDDQKRNDQARELSDHITDWHKFTIIASVQFTDEDLTGELPAPVTEFGVILPDKVGTPDTGIPGSRIIYPELHKEEVLDEDIVIKSSYVRPSAKRGASADYIKCPITGARVPAAEYSKHLSVVLLDKRWKQEKDELTERVKGDGKYTANLDVYNNILNVVLSQPEIFGHYKSDKKIKK